MVREPGKTGSQWRLHYSLQLPSLYCDHFVLTSTRGVDSAERFGRFSFQANEIVLADAGYSHPLGVQTIVRQKADVCVRFNPHALPLYEKNGERFDLSSALSRLRKTGAVAEWPVLVHAGEQMIRGRLCAIHKSQEAIQRAEFRLRQKRHKGKSAGPLTELCARYVLVFTTLTNKQAKTEKVLEMYRLRWQIELGFKRLQTIAQLGHLPKHDDRSSRAWLYGKLFLALLAEKMARVGRTISPWGYSIATKEDAQQMA